MSTEAHRKSISQQNAKATAIGLLCAKNLHQSLWLPATDSRPRTRVTFGTTQNFGDDSLPAILFIGPMFGSRYNALLADNLAKKIGVRLICVDRPGIGGSMPVPLNQRLKTWLETVPLLLDKVGVKHVSLITHSAGTVYLLNTLYHYRDILDPEAPFLAFFGPWVHNELSSATLMSMASKLPTSWFSGMSGLIQFINTRIAPVTSWSGGIVTSMTGLWKARSEDGDSDDETKAQETFGVDEQTAKEIDRLNMRYLFAESITGANEEALFCLKKSGPGLWGECDDYDVFIKSFVEREKIRRRQGDPGARRLEIRMYFAESDVMIGEGGRKYFEKVWNQYGVIDIAHVDSKVMAQTDHDSVIIDVVKGGLRDVFEEIRRCND